MQQQKRGQQHKQGYHADLNKYFGKRLKIKLNGKRVITGQVVGQQYDIFMNLVLENAQELIPQNKDSLQPGFSNPQDQLVHLGQTIVRGNSIIMWECIDRVRD